MTLPTQLQKLVGNPARYAVQKEDGTWYKVDEPLTLTVLRSHLAKEQTVGTYVNKGDEARTLVFDIDHLSDDGSEVNAIVEALETLGVPERYIAVEFSGRKGYHVWVVLSGYVSARDLRRIGAAALALAQVDCEVFPKQDHAETYGNLIKLPCGVHRVTRQSNDFIRGSINPLPPALFRKLVEQLPAEPEVKRSEPPPSMECLAHIQAQGPEKGWRNHGLFHLATMLRRGGLAGQHIREVVRQTNAKAAQPLDNAEVEALLESSQRSGPICGQLPVSVQCQDCPVRRSKGLYAKPGQLRHGGDGELVVVEIAKRNKKVVTVRHPDIADGAVVLK